MGYWENTTYVRHADASRIATTLRELFEREDMALVESPAPRARLAIEPMQYAGALENDEWGVAIAPGANGWCIVKTAPLELLGERRVGGTKPRLAELCAALGCEAVQLNAYEGPLVLLECGANGAYALSGYAARGEDPLGWNAEQIDEERVEARFSLLEGLELEPGDAQTAAEALARTLGGANAAVADNLVCVRTLIERRDLDLAGARTLHFVWSGAPRRRFAACDSWAAYRAQVSKNR